MDQSLWNTDVEYDIQDGIEYNESLKGEDGGFEKIESKEDESSKFEDE